MVQDSNVKINYSGTPLMKTQQCGHKTSTKPVHDDNIWGVIFHLIESI